MTVACVVPRPGPAATLPRMSNAGRVALAASMTILAAACGDSPRDRVGDGGGGGGDAGGGGGDAGGGGDGPRSDGEAYVFAHSSSALYRIDPDTLNITLVGEFDWPSFSDEMTDLAIDGDGRMIGISFGAVYEVDPVTARATLLSSSLPGEYNGLSFVPAEALGQTGPDVLVGLESTSGAVSRIDPLTGDTTVVGDMGGSFESSGDLVSVVGFGTVATAEGGGNDTLVRLAPSTFLASALGGTGFGDLWGLGYWKNRVFAFSEAGQFVVVDVTTGAGTLVGSGSVRWWGAAVTTRAPVVE